MSDNKNKRDYRNRDRINLNEPYEVEYWSKKFEISPSALEKIVKEVGPMVKDVEAAQKR